MVSAQFYVYSCLLHILQLHDTNMHAEADGVVAWSEVRLSTSPELGASWASV